MKIGNVKDFMQQQSGKVKQRQEEEKKIKKGIYQMQVMLDAQTTETLMKECDKADAKKTGENKDNQDSGTESGEGKKTDPKTEMEKMLSAATKAYAINNTSV